MTYNLFWFQVDHGGQDKTIFRETLDVAIHQIEVKIGSQHSKLIRLGFCITHNEDAFIF